MKYLNFFWKQKRFINFHPRYAETRVRTGSDTEPGLRTHNVTLWSKNVYHIIPLLWLNRRVGLILAPAFILLWSV